MDAAHVIVFGKHPSSRNAERLVSSSGGTLLFWFPEIGIAVASGNEPGFSATMRNNRSVSEVGVAGQWFSPQVPAYQPAAGLPAAEDAFYDPFQWDIRRVGAEQAWANGVSGSHDTIVAIIDSGIDATHPDLAPNVVYQACQQLAGPCFLDTVFGSHATHIAGTVAAAFGGDRGQLDRCTRFPPSGYPWYTYMIISTVPGGTYSWMAGTSMAAPHVAAAAALLIDENPELSPRQVKSILKRTADPVGDRQSFGSGMLNVPSALSAARK